ncbi:cytochrome-c oxidase, cbb3-type subunit III [Arhodomonas aquaeolei]|uniref:cytochrome-c oxidase, cbb3-type subunit III n=1 Tax=Arhodomonas aquaeolei TaxID=2369 RepID=UPI00035F733E|nr:cytochrome-c oxidase, cbb3-type subunit III [Arhodomonas aquaeolei]
MSSFWHWYIIVLTLGNIAACYWLIRWTAKPRPGEASATETTGHVWDGDLSEYNQPMPRWWLWLFYITIVFGLIYLVLYPGLGRFDGVLNWSQYSAYQQEVKQMHERTASLYESYAAKPVPVLANDPEAMDTGRRLFANNCSVCHGSDGRGAKGFPNLADASWQYGGEPETLKQTITNGRNGVMPALGASLGQSKLEAVAAYVYSLNGRNAPQELVDRGKDVFMTQCVACHGADAKGNPQIGALNLTDDTWRYGGSLETIKETILNGRNGQMPAQKELLTPEQIHVLAAYVYQLSGQAGQRSASSE